MTQLYNSYDFHRSGQTPIFALDDQSCREIPVPCLCNGRFMETDGDRAKVHAERQRHRVIRSGIRVHMTQKSCGAVRDLLVQLIVMQPEAVTHVVAIILFVRRSKMLKATAIQRHHENRPCEGRKQAGSRNRCGIFQRRHCCRPVGFRKQFR